MTAAKRPYRATESKYKGGAQEMYVSYDLAQPTQGGKSAVYPKVKRVYIAGQVKDWKFGDFTRRTGRKVHGVKIDYVQRRSAYQRQAPTAKRNGAAHRNGGARVPAGEAHFTRIVEVPKAARNVRFHKGQLPKKYQAARQRVR